MNQKLASLELQGYKTFAKQSTLKFPSPITAIIGPNGSGKSNIADSVRWVLGEQSYSVLRAKKTEDMIYSGSELRSRSGMASVSIAFDNSNGWLPVDYQEVVLTRRAYRDGQNEYLLNGQRVRLRDFHELLGRTGLGERTYTIIGQGLVDLALSIKPDERRKLFEEAAGIGIYRTRKEEALKRLEASERNLERATDIVDEIKPRLRSLEKQAARFGEYQIIEENLQKDLRDWYGYHWFKAQDEIASIQTQLQKAETNALKVQEVVDQATGNLGKLREEIQRKRNQISEVHTNLQAMHAELQSRNQTLAILEERSNSLQRSTLDLSKDRGNLAEILDAAKTGVGMIEQEIAKMSLDLSKAEKEKQEAKKRLDSETSARQLLDRKRYELQNQVVSLEKNLVGLRARQQSMKERLESIRKDQGSYRNSIQELKKQEISLVQKKSESEKNLNKAGNALGTIRSQRSNLASQNKALQAQLDENYQQNSKWNLEKNKFASQLDLLDQSQANNAGLSEGAKNLLRLNHGAKGSVLNDLASQLDIPEKFEKAIAAALGESIDLLVLSADLPLEKGLNTVAASVNGRVALTGKSWSNIAPAQNLNAGDPVLGLASELLGHNAEMQSVIKNLLGDTLVVESRDQFAALHNVYPDCNLVALNGDLLTKKGVLMLGQVNNQGKVSYQRRRRELVARLSSIESELEKVSATAELLRKQKAELDQKAAILAEDESTRQKLLQELEHALNTANLELAKIGNQEDWLNKQIEAQNRELSSSDLKFGELDVEIKRAEMALKDLNKNLEAVRNDLRLHPTDELQKLFNNAETEHRVLTQRLGLRKMDLSEAQARLEADTRRLSSTEARIQENKLQLEALTAQLNAMKDEISKASEAVKALEKNELEPRERELAELETQLEYLSSDESTKHKDLSNAERLVTHYQLELARQQEKLSSLRSRIDDDFGLIELEYRNAYTTVTPLPFPDLVIETLPEVAELPETIEAEIHELKAQIRRMGAVNADSQKEYQEVKQRFTDLTTQIKDLNAAIEDINKLVKELDQMMHEEFTKTFNAVAVEFSKMFGRLFNGGSAKLYLSDAEDPIEGGIEIEARLPGKREQGLVLLSGGERSLTAVALVFALLKISPTPFCILDEVDAMLDESNVGRFIELLKDLSEETQFILITHNRNTVQAADVIYGITMGKDGASQLMSVRLEDIDDRLLK